MFLYNQAFNKGYKTFSGNIIYDIINILEDYEEAMNKVYDQEKLIFFPKIKDLTNSSEVFLFLKV